MRRWQKISLTTLSVTFLLLFATAVILPEILRDKAIELVRQQTGRELQIERIILNLFNLQVDIRKLDLKEAGSDRTFLSFERLNFSLSLRSLIDRALIIDDLTLERPFLQLEKTGSNSFNFSDLIPPESSAPTENSAPAAPLLFSFNNLQIRSGTLVFFDSSSDLDLVHHIDELNLALPFVGNIPYLTDRYIQPAISLRIDGSPLVASGQMKPFDQSVETRIDLNLSDIDLPFYAAYLQPFLPFELTSGNLSTRLQIFYQVSQNQQPQLRIGGDLTLSALRLEQKGAPLFFMPLLLVELDWADPAAGEYHFSNISVYDPQLEIRRTEEGSLNLLQLVAHKEKKAPVPPSGEAPDRPLPHLTIETLRLREGRIDFSDKAPSGGFKSRIHDINLLVQKLSTRADKPAPLNFDFKTDHNEQGHLEAALRIEPLLVEGQFTLQQVPLGDYAPYLRTYLNQTPTGSANLQTGFKVTRDEQNLSQLRFQLTDLQQPFGGGDFFQLGELLIAGGELALSQRQLQLAEISLTKGALRLGRDQAGALPFERLLKRQPVPETEPAQTAKAEAPPQWRLRLDSFNLRDFNIRFLDGAAPQPAPVKINHLNLSLADIHWPEAVESAWQLDGRWAAGGTFSSEGRLRHTPLSAKGNLRFNRLDLTALNSYIPATIRLQLANGKLDTRLAFDLAQQQALSGTVTGKLGLRSVSVTGIDEELLHWESLQLDGLKAELHPLRLEISQVSLNNYLAKIRVRDDGQINLNQIAAEAPASAQEVAQETSPTAASLFPLRVDELTLQGGEVSFVDKHLPKLYATTMYELGGRISGLSSEPGRHASVDLRGSLENHSPLTISGRISPLAGDLDTELKVRFTDIDLAPATPYSGTYLGYTIDKGKLYLDLDYQIANRQVKASNKIFLDQFTFGPAVESKEATGLPVRLAVALLKDRRGEIHLDLPISGSTDDPEFGLFSTVITLLKNLLIKAATAPFSLLASMFGGGDDFTQISFPAGVATLDANAQEKLVKLSQMLTERPALKLELSAFVDPAADPEGYRREQLQQQVDTEWRRRTSPAPDLNISAELYLENLRRVYSRAKFPKPRNAFGMQKNIPAAEMEKLLLANMRVGEEELSGLAKARAAAVQDELVRQNGELRSRIFLKNTEIRTPPEKDQSPARVEFGIAAD